MRLALNGYLLREPYTGSGQYTSNLVRTLSRQEGLDLSLLYPAGTSTEALLPAGPPGGAAIRMETAMLPSFVGENLAKVWWEQVSMGRLAARAGGDLLHSPYFASPLRASLPSVVTIHDVIPLVLPPYRGSLRVRLYTWLVAAAARRCAAVITDSEHARSDIERVLGIARERIHVVPLAVSPQYQPQAAPAEGADLRERYGLPAHFVLYLGGLDRRKDVTTLLRAFAASRGDLPFPVTLAIAGGLRPRATPLYPDLRQEARHLGLEGAVRFLGQVPEKDKAPLLRAADLFIFPSLYEGFGLPPLEAMACGAPTICAASSSLPEVVGEDAVLFAPGNAGELAARMVELLRDGTTRERLKAQGPQRAARFSWHAVATRTMAVYRQALAGQRAEESEAGRVAG